MKKSQDKHNKRGTANIIFICCCLIFVFSLIKIILIIGEYKDSRDIYNEIAKTAEEGSNASVSDMRSNASDSDVDPAASDSDSGIDFESLKKINKDVIGWIRIDGTKIDYPIVKAQNNDKYLNIRFDGSYGGAGTLFADCSTQDPFQEFNTIVYGHHMKDGTMFNDLKYYKSEDFYNEHKVIDLILPDKECSVEVAAFLNVASDSYIYVAEISAEEDKQKYLDLIDEEALYSTDVRLDLSDELIILSTCAYEFENARYVVVGRITP